FSKSWRVLWAVFLNGEKIVLPVVMGAVLIVLGVWLLSIEKKSSVETQGRIPVKGVILALAAALAWSISILLVNLAVKISSNMEHVFAVNALRIWAAAIFLLALSPMLDRNFEFIKVKMRVLIALLVGGIIAIGAGWFLLALSFLYIPESQAVPISSTTPFFSTLFGIAFLHEKVTLKVFFGSILIVFGIFLIFAV
ncbi:MAG: DMT family transporter, partial [Candidatus Bathyarchaeia archaeon]